MSDDDETRPAWKLKLQEVVVKAGLGFGAVFATVQVIGGAWLIGRRLVLEARILLGHDVQRPVPIERRVAEHLRRRLRPTRRERLQRAIPGRR